MIRKSWTHSSNGFFLYWRQEHNVCMMNTNIPPVFALLVRLYAPAMTPKLWMLAWIVSPIRQTAHIHSAHEKNHAKWSVRLVVWLLWNGHNEKKRRSNTRTSLDNNTNDFVRPIWYAALSMRTKTTLKYYNLWSIRARYFCAIPLHVHRKATRIILFFCSLSLFKATFRGLRTSRMVVIKWLYAEGIQ